MATHIFRGSSKQEAYQNLHAMVGDDVFIIREFVDQEGLYCIEAAPKVSSRSVKQNAIPQNATPQNTTLNPQPEVARSLSPQPQDTADRYTISQLLSQLRLAGFPEPTLRQFIYWVKNQNENNPSANLNRPKDIALYKFAEYLELQKVIAPILEVPHTPILLVGPPGSGKTVTTARLCARALMQGQEVEFVTLDCVRTGAVEQARSLTQFLDIKLVEINNVSQFQNWMNKFNRDLNQSITFIDSLSTNIYDMQDMRWLLDYMEAAEQNDVKIEPILVISATTDATTIGDYATTFKSMGIDRAILTCWDIASKPAGTFSAIIDAGMQISMVCDSPYLTGGMEKLTNLTLAKKLVAKKGMPAWLAEIGKLK
ncbi:MAG: AAA family ATPase [Rhizobiales bacterium]|nr:AAA family ATPase [Hyphomicrobiales bacterium]NRB14123.1 AAA family ATPase [Hyphomicrobiales bacterium]